MPRRWHSRRWARSVTTPCAGRMQQAMAIAIAIAFGAGFGLDHMLARSKREAMLYGACVALNTASAYGLLDSEGRRRTLHLLANGYNALPLAGPRTFRNISDVCASLARSD